MTFTTEQQSKDFFKQYLQKKGFEKIIEPEDQYCYYDIEAEKDNKKYRFELKRRNMTSTKYGDGIMEIYKYNMFLKDKNQYDYAVLVSLFYDCIALSNIKQPIEKCIKVAALTTDFNNHQMAEKKIIRYNLLKKINYENT